MGLRWWCPRITQDGKKSVDLPSPLLPPGESRVGLIKVSRGPARQMAPFPIPLPHGESKEAELCLIPNSNGRMGWRRPNSHSYPMPSLCPGSLPPRDLKGLEVKASVKILSQRVVQGCTVPLCSLSTHCQPNGLTNGGHSDDPLAPLVPHGLTSPHSQRQTLSNNQLKFSECRRREKVGEGRMGSSLFGQK